MTTVAVIDSKQAFPFGVVQDGVVGVLEIEIATITSIVSIVFLPRPTHLLADPPALHAAGAVAEVETLLVSGMFLQHRL